MLDQDQRYQRQMILPGWGSEAQAKLSQSRVLIMGLGGLGGPASLFLNSAGVGHLGLAEFDRVDESNLHRQILFAETSVGRPKIEVAAEMLHSRNRNLSLELFSDGIPDSDLVSVFRRYDLILDGTDNFPSRYLHNDAAFFAQRPLVSGSILRWQGQVVVFNPTLGGACLRCLFPKPPDPGSIPNCAEAGVVGALCGIVGSWQALEALKMLTGIGQVSTTRIWIFDALQPTWRSLRIKADPECPLCGKSPVIKTVKRIEGYLPSCPVYPSQTDMKPENLTPAESVRLLNAAEKPAFLLDVREADEWETARVEDACWIPMNAVPQRLDEIPSDRHILVLCHHGGRSLAVARFLKKQGFSEVSNVAGGIDAWAVSVDPQIPRY